MGHVGEKVLSFCCTPCCWAFPAARCVSGHQSLVEAKLPAANRRHSHEQQELDCCGAGSPGRTVPGAAPAPPAPYPTCRHMARQVLWLIGRSTSAHAQPDESSPPTLQRNLTVRH